LRALLDRGILLRRLGGERVNRCIRVTAGTREQGDRFLAALREVLSA
jgi:histidinol-phosphate/aromatic aminotransferase/cobyric acid decarboxylase-like protein